MAVHLRFEMDTAGQKFSEYYNELDTSVKKRYQKKLKSIEENVDDPYIFGPGLGITDFMPEVEYQDIYNFLINTPSPYTKDKLKAYKSL